MVQTKYYGAEGGPQKSGRNEADAQEGQRFSTQQTQALAQNSTEFQMPGMSFHAHPVRFSGPDYLRFAQIGKDAVKNLLRRSVTPHGDEEVSDKGPLHLAMKTLAHQPPRLVGHPRITPQGRRSQLPAAASAIVRSGQKPEMSSGKEDLRMANGKGAGLLAFIYPPEAIPEGKGRRRNKHRGSPS